MIGTKPPWLPGRPQTPARRVRLRLPGWRHWQPLLHQQCWCWGEDIRRPEGNLLLARGLGRVRGLRNSRYTQTTGGEAVTLWGFGAAYGVEGLGGVFIERFTLRLRLGPVRPPDGWSAAELVGYSAPRSAEELARAADLFRRFAVWVADYERWVAETMPRGYRQAMLDRWDHPAVPATEMERAWRQISGR
jgi:hypothetical protein